MEKIIIIKLALLLLSSSLCLAAPMTFEIAAPLASEVGRFSQAKGKCVSIAIVDESAQLVYFERQACAHIGSIETSIDKAKSSSLFQKPTSDFVAALKNGMAGIVTAKGVIAVEGGIPIYLNNKFIGAIGVGGATSLEDEEFAKMALTK